MSLPDGEPAPGAVAATQAAEEVAASLLGPEGTDTIAEQPAAAELPEIEAGFVLAPPPVDRVAAHPERPAEEGLVLQPLRPALRAPADTEQQVQRVLSLLDGSGLGTPERLRVQLDLGLESLLDLLLPSLGFELSSEALDLLGGRLERMTAIADAREGSSHRACGSWDPRIEDCIAAHRLTQHSRQEEELVARSLCTLPLARPSTRRQRLRYMGASAQQTVA